VSKAVQIERDRLCLGGDCYECPNWLVEWDRELWPAQA